MLSGSEQTLIAVLNEVVALNETSILRSMLDLMGSRHDLYPMYIKALQFMVFTGKGR